ncbi:MAG: hypothetical protein U5K56_05480 [Halioglobus sp.]|nr:hypothetical protein [Halioglobus sp.]
MNDIGPLDAGNLDQPARQRVDHGKLAGKRQRSDRSTDSPAAMELEAIDLLHLGERLAPVVFGAGHLHGFPAHGSLFPDNCPAAERVAALQRDRMIQHM